MKYFAINFPNHMTLMMKTSEDYQIEDVMFSLYASKGIQGISGVVYNPLQFISVESITSPDDRQKTSARNLVEMLL